MNQNPYSGDYQDPILNDGPARTSVLAVASLVLSLICCIPGLPLLGAGLGVGAVIGIGGSRGRIGGRGMAVAGIVLGILMTVAQATVAVMTVQGIDWMSRMMFGSARQMMTEVEAANYDGARAAMAGPVAGASNEQFEAFRARYRAEYGSFVSIPSDFGEIIEGWIDLGPRIQPYQGRQNMIPIPARFDNGPALVITIIDQNTPPATQPGGAVTLPVTDVWIVLPDGSELRLMDQAGGAPTP